MAGEFTVDISALDRALRLAPDAVSRGISTALTDIKNDWRAESVDIAPLKDNTLRPSITGNIFNAGNEGRVELTANAVRNDGFNYAYYIHEDAGKAVTGEKKFLDKPAQENQDKWRRWLEDEIQSELRGAGW